MTWIKCSYCLAINGSFTEKCKALTTGDGVVYSDNTSNNVVLWLRKKPMKDKTRNSMG